MNFATFDLNLLRVFDALLRERSVTRAGDLIGLSQSAVSNALSRLRHHFADELFVRRGNDMVPTPRAEGLARPIQQALAQIEGAVSEEAEFDPAQVDRIFTLCGADFFSLLLMPRLRARVAAVAPRAVLRMVDGAAGDVAGLLRDSVVDIALERDMDIPADWVSSAALLQSPFVAVAARGNPVIARAGTVEGDSLSIDTFCAVPHALRSADGSLSGIVDEVLAGVGRNRRVALALPHFHAVAVSVATSEMIAVIPEQSAREAAKSLDLAIYQPSVPIPSQPLRLYWHRRHDRSPVFGWLREQVFAAVEQMQRETTGKAG